MAKEMLINCLQPEECRIAILENGQLEELYVERANSESIVGNIYKGKIVNIEAGIQAAFVDFGTGRNGFLHVSDVDPAYFRHLLPQEVLDQLDAEDAEYESGRGGARGGQRPVRGDRRDRNDRGDRGPREWGPPPQQPPADNRAPVATSWTGQPTQTRSELLDNSGFGEGIEEGAAFEEVYEEVVIEDSAEFANEIAIVDRPPPLPKPKIDVKVAEPDLESGFGADLFDDEFKAPAADLSGPIAVSMEEKTEEKPAESDEKPKRKPRATRKKVEEPAAAGEDEEKPKKRVRRKKGDADESDSLPMPSAEHRTSPPDEPEIKSFFEDDLAGFDAGFDPNAPNDRFMESSAAPTDEEIVPLEFEKVADEEFVDESAPLSDEEFDAQFAPKPMRDDDRGGRNDRRGRPRNGERRDRDHGTRVGGDRGPRPGGPGGDRDRGMGGPRKFSDGNRSHARDRGLPRMPIEKIFKRGQEVIVQVIKDGMGTKGPTLSTFVSIAGRYLVLMPHLSRIGVSRKIEDGHARRRLREILNELEPPKGVGFIVRTAAIDRNAEELQGDLLYLLKLWQSMVRRIKKSSGPIEIYRESDIITRTIRDNFKSDIDRIIVDEPIAFQQASEFMQIVMPRYANRISLYDQPEPLFHIARVEDELQKINQKRLDLPGGGSIIIEQTEALVAIDVNSGNFRAENNAEETAFQMNLRAAREIARQLRLRDLGGVIVNDFIDMRSEAHRRAVEDELTKALERDKAKTKILRISQFGIIEMTRQRMQPSLKKRIYNECSHCKATGMVKNAHSMGIDAMRTLLLAASRSPHVSLIHLSVHSDVAAHLLNKKRREIAAIEERAQVEITIDGLAHVSPEHLELKCSDGEGSDVKIVPTLPLKMGQTDTKDEERRRENRGGKRRRN